MSKRLGDLIELPKPTLARPSGPLETARVVFAGASIVLVEHPGRGRLTLRICPTRACKQAIRSLLGAS